MTEIKIADIKEVVNRLLDHIAKTRGVETVEIDNPFYWNIPATEIYDVTRYVAELDIGSLDDDWEFVSGLLDPSGIPVTYQLTEVAPLLRYIGETLGPALAKDGG